MNPQYTINTDGGARGNPGPAAVGITIKKNGVMIKEFGAYIGETTNNVAEYTAVIYAFESLREMDIEKDALVTCFLDSLLVVNQLNGLFKIKDAKLRELSFRVHTLEQNIGAKILYKNIPREQNARADFFVNKSLDEYMR